jgi:hypothetical protein
MAKKISELAGTVHAGGFEQLVGHGLGDRLAEKKDAERGGERGQNQPA